MAETFRRIDDDVSTARVIARRCRECLSEPAVRMHASSIRWNELKSVAGNGLDIWKGQG